MLSNPHKPDFWTLECDVRLSGRTERIVGSSKDLQHGFRSLLPRRRWQRLCSRSTRGLTRADSLIESSLIVIKQISKRRRLLRRHSFDLQAGRSTASLLVCRIGAGPSTIPQEVWKRESNDMALSRHGDRNGLN